MTLSFSSLNRKTSPLWWFCYRRKSSISHHHKVTNISVNRILRLGISEIISINSSYVASRKLTNGGSNKQSYVFCDYIAYHQPLPTILPQNKMSIWKNKSLAKINFQAKSSIFEFCVIFQGLVFGSISISDNVSLLSLRQTKDSSSNYPRFKIADLHWEFQGCVFTFW